MGTLLRKIKIKTCPERSRKIEMKTGFNSNYTA